MKRDMLEKEIEEIENDDHLTNAEKAKEIREAERDYDRAARDSAQESYDNEYSSW